jgi:hypothetical protein
MIPAPDWMDTTGMEVSRWARIQMASYLVGVSTLNGGLIVVMQFLERMSIRCLSRRHCFSQLSALRR